MIKVGIPPRINPNVPLTLTAVNTFKKAVTGINQTKCQNEFSVPRIVKKDNHHQITMFLFGIVANSCLVKTPILQPIIKNKPNKIGINSI